MKEQNIVHLKSEIIHLADSLKITLFSTTANWFGIFEYLSESGMNSK